MSAPAGERKEKAASAGPGAPPELVPVPASVFDDDFFRASSSRVELIPEMEATHFSASAGIQAEEVCRVTEEVFPFEAPARVPSFGGATTVEDQAVPDELDIPAFLRRGN